MHDAAPKTIHVLIIDDDRDIRETLGELLVEEGFAVEAAWNGETASARLQAGFRPDVIVLDMMMPVMDGRSFRAWQRSHPELAHIPVIGISAAGTPKDLDFECLPKPIRFELLVDKLRRATATP